MNIEDLIRQYHEYFQILFEEEIITDQEIRDSFGKYVRLRSLNKSNQPVYFNDWLIGAINGCEKSIAFLKFYQTILENILGNSILSKDKLKTKIRNSIFTMVERGYPSYRDALGELFLFEYLIKIQDYQCLGIDFELGNGKDADIVFKNDKNQIQIIEIRNIHKLINKELKDVLEEIVSDKISKKTEQIDEIKQFFETEYPNHEVTISILPFIWEESFDIEAGNDDIDRVLNDFNDDLLQPMTLLCEEITSAKEFHYSICQLSDVLGRIKQLKKQNHDE